MGGNQLKIKDQTLQLLKKEDTLLSRKELMQRLSLPPKERGIFSRVLADLEQEGRIVRTRRNRYGLPLQLNLLSGTLQGHKKGFAFLIPDDPEQEDVYIPMERRDGAMHGDRVLVRSYPGRKKGREGQVTRIVERKNCQVVGQLQVDKSGRFAHLIPDDQRISYHIFIPGEKFGGALPNQKVVVQITHWPERNKGPQGQVVEVLGFAQEPGVDIEGIIRLLDLPREFPPLALKEAENLTSTPTQEEMEGRLDLRDLFIFTIDGEDAKDFDDAISLIPKGAGRMQLGVHIADVSHYVRPGDPLDIEAQRRGVSIYLLDRVIPMLPPALSNHFCSLKEGEDRLTYSLLMTLKGTVVEEYTVKRSVIRVKRRLTYRQVNAILTGERGDSDLEQILFTMQTISQELREERMENGSLDFHFPEVKIILDPQGRPLRIQKEESGPGESLIEECMLLANQKIAQFILEKGVPSLYRVHERPPADKIEELNTFLKSLGYGIKARKGRVQPKAIQDLLHRCQGKEEERPIQNMILRSLPQARYAAENIGHFGLAIDLYTHFTSPIRRYPDLVIHRILSLITSRTLDDEALERIRALLPEVAELASKRERLAMEAEWEVEDLKKVEYMREKIGQVFSGVINGVIGSGFFVELENTVEGFVRATQLEDDDYYFNPKQMALTGARSGRSYRLGDRVTVQVEGVNQERKEIDFHLVKEER